MVTRYTNQNVVSCVSAKARCMWSKAELAMALQHNDCCLAEAHAALSAVEWQMGQAGAAEEHFATATAIEPRWRNMEFVHVQTRWPPKLYAAMQKFLRISPG